ncbi:MAG: hypothetical protein J6B46_07970 [Parabacteroides sp.]|nr:hypothetical protein [Parabacteroides sp.]
MKMEEYREDKQNKWFPLSKGFNRLLISLAGILVFISVIFSDEDDRISVFFIVTFFLLVLYIICVWVYNGFIDKD